jgi:hypothetical protein
MFFTASRPRLGPTKPPRKWVLRVIYLGVNRPSRKANHYLPSAKDKNVGVIPPLPISLHGVVLN